MAILIALNNTWTRFHANSGGFMTKLTHLTFVSLLLASCTPAKLVLSQNQSSKASWITPTERRTFLREHDGIEKLSAVIGDVTLHDFDEMWSGHNLESLISSSDVIVEATIEKNVSSLDDDRSDRLTEYGVRTTEVLKGKDLPNLRIICRGGELKLPNGHKVISHTAVWDQLRVGETYIFFLKPVENRYRLVASARSVLAVNSSDSLVHVLDIDPKHALDLKKQVEGVNSLKVKSAIKTNSLNAK